MKLADDKYESVIEFFNIVRSRSANIGQYYSNCFHFSLVILFIFDSMYIGYFLSAVFEDEVLKKSSAPGIASNSNKKRKKLTDTEKLNFIEGFYPFNFF